MVAPDSDQLAEAAAMRRWLLALVGAGELEVRTPGARALVRRLEGATIAAALAAGIHPEQA